MTFEEIDKLVGESLSIFGTDTERRDYRKLESENPGMFKGYGDKNGVMYLVDVSDDTYIDFFIRVENTSMVFREDDEELISLTLGNDISKENLKDYIDAFLALVDESENTQNILTSRLRSFSGGTIPIDLHRVNKINTIIS
jgi:hypothetical protein